VSGALLAVTMTLGGDPWGVALAAERTRGERQHFPLAAKSHRWSTRPHPAATDVSRADAAEPAFVGRAIGDTNLVDLLRLLQPAMAKRPDGGGPETAERGVPFYMRKPPADTQTTKNVAERGGVNPCSTLDAGFGRYDRWRPLPLGQLLIPTRGGVASDGQFDLVIHFHGHEAIRKEWVKVMDGTLLVGIDLGTASSAYAAQFEALSAFSSLVNQVETAVAKTRGLPRAKVRNLGLSAWSAGYAAIGQILSQLDSAKRVDAVILLDGLHASYVGDDLDTRRLSPFVDFARLAKARRKFMYVSHSSIIPPDYASTTETENYLVFALSGTPRSASARAVDPWGLELNSRFDSGDFHMRGFDGDDEMDHCAQIGLLDGVLDSFLKPRWRYRAASTPDEGPVRR